MFVCNRRIHSRQITYVEATDGRIRNRAYIINSASTEHFMNKTFLVLKIIFFGQILRSFVSETKALILNFKLVKYC